MGVTKEKWGNTKHIEIYTLKKEKEIIKSNKEEKRKQEKEYLQARGDTARSSRLPEDQNTIIIIQVFSLGTTAGASTIICGTAGACPTVNGTAGSSSNVDIIINNGPTINGDTGLIGGSNASWATSGNRAISETAEKKYKESINKIVQNKKK